MHLSFWRSSNMALALLVRSIYEAKNNSTYLLSCTIIFHFQLQTNKYILHVCLVCWCAEHWIKKVKNNQLLPILVSLKCEWEFLHEYIANFCVLRLTITYECTEIRLCKACKYTLSLHEVSVWLLLHILRVMGGIADGEMSSLAVFLLQIEVTRIKRWHQRQPPPHIPHTGTRHCSVISKCA